MNWRGSNLNPWGQWMAVHKPKPRFGYQPGAGPLRPKQLQAGDRVLIEELTVHVAGPAQTKVYKVRGTVIVIQYGGYAQVRWDKYPGVSLHPIKDLKRIS